jgi:23S rRNA G2069 N7-methylase RlmK/C1962 C5-methylase RlmI
MNTYRGGIMPNPNNNKKFNDEALRINRSLKKENDKLKELIIPMQDLGRSLKKENDELKYQVDMYGPVINLVYRMYCIPSQSDEIMREIKVLLKEIEELRGQNEKQ